MRKILQILLIGTCLAHPVLGAETKKENSHL